jgi:RES domain
MHASDRLRAVLPRLPRITLHGPWSRAVGFHLVTSPPPGAPLGSSPQPLWPGGARLRGARFTPREGFDSLYLATDPITALTEVVAVFQAPAAAAVTLKSHPWVVITVEGVLHDVLDLTDPVVQRELGTSVQELTGEWAYAQSTIGKAKTQRLGEAAFVSEAILGFYRASWAEIDERFGTGPAAPRGIAAPSPGLGDADRTSRRVPDRRQLRHEQGTAWRCGRGARDGRGVQAGRGASRITDIVLACGGRCAVWRQ